MATKRDLVEAYSFSRRRLVTAFVSGAPGGREVEPARPLRTVFGGLALAVLLVAGAAIAGVLLGRDPADWNRPGLLVSKDKAGLYAILDEREDPVLHPVLNITSGQLLMGSDAAPTVVSGETIAEQELGTPLGIFGSPQEPPAPSRLIDSGWTACVRPGAGLALDLSTAPQVTELRDTGFLVRVRDEAGDRYFVLAPGRAERDRPVRVHSYPVPDVQSADALLDSVGLPDRVEALTVPEQWLTLFPSGGALTFDSFGLTGFGDPAPGAGTGGLPADARVGQVVTVGGESPQLLTADGPVDLDPFTLNVYLGVQHPGGVDVGPVDLPRAPQVDGGLSPFAEAHWPDQRLTSAIGDPCALLVAEPGEMPSVVLATDPVGAASAEGVAEGRRRISVDDGHGAYVLSGDWDDTSSQSAWLADPLGLVYPLEGAETPRYLGYGDHEPPLVPDPWIELFDAGVVLSRDAARCPPTREGGDRSCVGGEG